MRAVVYDTSGARQGVLRVADLPEPAPSAGEVCVRVIVSGVNPTDWKARGAARPRPWAQQVPHQDGAGVVHRVGEGVDPARLGERVWIYHAAHDRPGGTAAEFVCLPADQAVPLPDGCSFDLGAGLGIPGMTAHRCLFADGAIDGATVLVTGGAGAVGHAAIQLARWAGARVIATVSTSEKALIAESAGADVVLGYREPSFAADLHRAAGSGIDAVVDVDVASNLSTYLEVLAKHAVVASYASGSSPLTVAVSPLMRSNAVLRFVHVYSVPKEAMRQAVEDLGQALRGGALRPLPFHRYPLERAGEAHEASRGGVTGKVLLDVSAP